MYKTLAIQISLIFQVLANSLPGNRTYAALIKEKGELFKEINEAIQESVAVLRKNNETEAVLGIEYMNQLKEQLKEINENKITASNNDSNVDTRRRNVVTLNEADIARFLYRPGANVKKNVQEIENLNQLKKQMEISGYKITPSNNDRHVDTRRRNKIALSMAEIAQFLYRPKVNETEKANENQVRVQKDLDTWVTQQLAEKAMKAKKRKIQVIKEKCPRFGLERKKKKKTRRQYGGPTADRDYNSSASCENDATSTKSPQRKYPCCRKCCKKSYMGCL